MLDVVSVGLVASQVHVPSLQDQHKTLEGMLQVAYHLYRHVELEHFLMTVLHVHGEVGPLGLGYEREDRPRGQELFECDAGSVSEKVWFQPHVQPGFRRIV